MVQRLLILLPFEDGETHIAESSSLTERTVGVPSSTYFGIVVFELEGGDVAIVVEQVCLNGADGFVHVSDVMVFQCVNIDVVKGGKELVLSAGGTGSPGCVVGLVVCVGGWEGHRVAFELACSTDDQR